MERRGTSGAAGLAGDVSPSAHGPRRCETPVVAAHLAHPLLDPHLPRRNPALARLWVRTYLQLQVDPGAYEQMVRSFALPGGGRDDGVTPLPDLGGYFRDADGYLDDLLALGPLPLLDRLAPTGETRAAGRMIDLMRLAFTAEAARGRYEAQRKLYEQMAKEFAESPQRA